MFRIECRRSRIGCRRIQTSRRLTVIGCTIGRTVCRRGRMCKKINRRD
jgi:hypothetical protein